MERNLALKLFAICCLMALLLAGLFYIRSIVTERQQRRDGVVQDIARSSSMAQELTGPIVVVPYEKTVRDNKEEAGTGRQYIEERQVEGKLYFLPESLRIDGALRTERRARGIYEARLYHADLRLAGRFDLPAHFGITEDLASYRFGAPSIALTLSDIRGIESTPKVIGNGVALQVLPGSPSTLLGRGFYALLPGAAGADAMHLQFDVQMTVAGTSEFHLIPVGRDTEVSLRSNWPHPGFTGEYLPTRHDIDAKGLDESLRKCASEGSCAEFNGRHLGVSFVDPVDQYLKTDRAIKYALLFIFLTFAGFFLFELLARLAVHPVQYGLVGTALAVFYLLLLSLSEHIGFGPAYLLSSSACVALLGYYIAHVLKGTGRGAGFAAALAALYGLLYGLLSADDYSLLMGSLLVFGLLTAVMVLTRNIDWFSLGRKDEGERASAVSS
jgi:inner membrane protein